MRYRKNKRGAALVLAALFVAVNAFGSTDSQEFAIKVNVPAVAALCKAGVFAALSLASFVVASNANPNK